MNNHMEQAAKAAKKPPTNEASAGLSFASDIGALSQFRGGGSRYSHT